VLQKIFGRVYSWNHVPMRGLPDNILEICMYAFPRH